MSEKRFFRVRATHSIPGADDSCIGYAASHEMCATSNAASVRALQAFVSAARADGCEVEIVEVTERRIEELPS